MVSFTVLAGDFTAGRPGRKKLVLKFLKRRLTLGSFLRSLSAWEKVPIREIESLQVATEQSTKLFGTAAVAGLVGGVLLGGAGLVAGALAGGNKKTVTFAFSPSGARSEVRPGLVAAAAEPRVG